MRHAAPASPHTIPPSSQAPPTQSRTSSRADRPPARHRERRVLLASCFRLCRKTRRHPGAARSPGGWPSDWSGRRRMGEKSSLELCKQLSGAPPLAVVAGLQRLQEADEVLVADSLELADGQARRLLVRLHG